MVPTSPMTWRQGAVCYRRRLQHLCTCVFFFNRICIAIGFALGNIVIVWTIYTVPMSSSSPFSSLRAPSTALELTSFTDEIVAMHKPFCLDGKPAKYYFARGSKENEDNFIIFFQGGGWCYTHEECLLRSRTRLGSPRFLSSTRSARTLLSANPEENPEFYAYQRVYVPSCDGASFSGSRNEPVEGLWYRGKHIIDAVLEQIGATKAAKNVLVTGCSAGGLAAFLHADYIRQQLPHSNLQRFKVLPSSGFFLFHNSVYGEPIFEAQMKHVFEMQNVSTSLNQKCLAAMPHHDAYKCFSAAATLPFIESPTFIYNSAYDEWMINCIVAVDKSTGCRNAIGWEPCAKNLKQCDAMQLSTLHEHANAMLAEMARGGAFSRPGNGVFIHSCWQHCMLNTEGLWGMLQIHNTTAKEAILAWWQAEPAADARDHVYLPCQILPGKECNPSCAGVSVSRQ